jgi:hypothetical protein
MKVELDRNGINDLDLQPAMHQQMHWHARRIAVYAKRLAPVWSGHYRRSIRAEKDITSRALALVTSDDRKAMLMEYGSKHNKAFHTLATACKRAGYLTYEVVR